MQTENTYLIPKCCSLRCAMRDHGGIQFDLSSMCFVQCRLDGYGQNKSKPRIRSTHLDLPTQANCRATGLATTQRPDGHQARAFRTKLAWPFDLPSLSSDRRFRLLPAASLNPPCTTQAPTRQPATRPAAVRACSPSRRRRAPTSLTRPRTGATSRAGRRRASGTRPCSTRRRRTPHTSAPPS
jgi:hypothetical protein